jgi:hypothetical protein
MSEPMSEPPGPCEPQQPQPLPPNEVLLQMGVVRRNTARSLNRWFRAEADAITAAITIRADYGEPGAQRVMKVASLARLLSRLPRLTSLTALGAEAGGRALTACAATLSTFVVRGGEKKDLAGLSPHELTFAPGLLRVSLILNGPRLACLRVVRLSGVAFAYATVAEIDTALGAAHLTVLQLPEKWAMDRVPVLGSIGALEELEVTVADLDGLQTYGDTLRYLTVTLTEFGTYEPLRACWRLETLRFNETYDDEDDGHWATALACPGLVRLHGAVGDDADFDALRAACPRLRELRLQLGRDVYDPDDDDHWYMTVGCRGLATLVTLERLTLWRVGLIGNVASLTALTALTNLTVLQVLDDDDETATNLRAVLPSSVTVRTSEHGL